VLAYAFGCRLLPYVLRDLAGVSIDPETTWYPWNFSPVATTCVFLGAIVPQRGRVTAMLMALMIGGDLFIDLLTGFQWWTLRNQFVQLWVYGCVLLVAALGRRIQGRPGWLTGVPAALVGEGLFFVITNFAVWLSGFLAAPEPPLYALTAGGLAACYVAALPFFGRSLLSTAIYAGLFFSPWGLGLARLAPRKTALPVSSVPAYEPARR
jgi:hypothetical protein